MRIDGTSVVAERFIRILKNEIYKYVTSISKNVYINKWDDIVHKYNSTCHSTIKMKPVDVKSNTYINSTKETNDEYPKFKIGGIVRISKFKSIFAKCLFQIGLKKFLLLQKLKALCRGHMLLVISMEKKLLEYFTKRIEKSKSKRV